MSKTALIFFIICTVLTARETGARYLIIAHDDFYNAALPLAQWKHKKGMRAKLVQLSEIGYSQYQIKNYITNAYHNWQIRPEYLLLVGAPNYIPFPQVSGTYSDNYYTDIEGDFFNEILSGRLTVHTPAEAQTVINKILDYERTPYREDNLWFKKACLIVNVDYDPPDDSIYWSDAHYAAQLMVENGFIEIDTLCDLYGHNSSSVINAVNQGRSIIMYRGTGLNNWSPPFDVNPDQTQNHTMLPIVLSTTCRTIGTGSTPAAAEKWLLTGTPPELRGAAGYFATTTVVIDQAYLRSAVAKGFHRALFNEQKRTFGECCEGARQNVYSMYPYSGGLYEYLGFTTLGDPEMNIWTDTPCSLLVQHQEYVPIGHQNITVNVKSAADSTPIADAIVCLTAKIDSGVFAVDTTDTIGNACFDLDLSVIHDTIFVTITGKNLQPYEGRITVVSANPYLIYYKAIINDSLFGNNDGCINPTEEIELPLWVKNIGESTGIDIKGVLKIEDPYIAVTDSVKYFADVPGNDSAFTGEDGYNFTVPYSCPNQYRINFELRCTDINDSLWCSTFEKTVYAPDFHFNGFTIEGGNGNNIIDPGETLQVIVSIKNNGDAPADSVTGVLKCRSFEVYLLDSLSTFGHIGIDSCQDNSTDPYVIYIDPFTAPGTNIDMNIELSSNYLKEKLTFKIVIMQKNYYIWNPDPTPLSGQNIHNILSNLGYAGDYGTQLPDSMEIYQTLFICLGVYSNRYLIENGSYEAEVITSYLNQGGNVYLEGSSAWFVDPAYFNGYDFGPLFGINAPGWSHGDLGPIAGQDNTFTRGMWFSYGGENSYMDHINPTGTGFLLFKDVDDLYNCAVANTTSYYRTVGTSFELGLLNDTIPPSTRAALLDSIMNFFHAFNYGIDEITSFTGMNGCLFQVMPNPCTGKLIIEYNLGSDEPDDAILSIYDVSGRLLREFTDLPVDLHKKGHLIWDGKDRSGRKVAQGIYFIRLSTAQYDKTHKVVFIR